MSDWREERCVAAEEGLEASLEAATRLLAAMESGKDVEAAMADVEEAVATDLDADVARAALMERRLRNIEADLDARQAAADSAEAEATAALRVMDEKNRLLAAEWEELKDLPKMLEDKPGSLGHWRQKLETSEKLNADLLAQTTQSKNLANDLRTSYHYLLHKLHNVAETSYRLSTADRIRRADEPGRA
eukprot:Rhum_TRINITY_DN19011_c0_g1::Rhum_TRINITY_DN19011_c0_g1_i1::g.169037::m.169037